eukprot:244654-Pelagomonas_calceolata.AAC.2
MEERQSDSRRGPAGMQDINLGWTELQEVFTQACQDREDNTSGAYFVSAGTECSQAHSQITKHMLISL